MGGLTYGLVRWCLAVPLNQIEATASNVRKKCYVIRWITLAQVVQTQYRAPCKKALQLECPVHVGFEVGPALQRAALGVVEPLQHHGQLLKMSFLKFKPAGCPWSPG